MGLKSRSARPTLSVCCVTGGPADRVAALLALFRPLADEIVVAVDSSSDESDFSPVLGLADRAFSVFVGPVGAERAIDWLQRECSGDWVLRLDSDEVPSAAFLEALPSLVAAQETLQYIFPRRWSFPDPHSWLDERPWAPDWQPRLARNLPGMRLTADPWHAGLAPVTPRRFVLEPIYHLDCAISPLSARQRKSERYEQLHPGWVAENGTRVNSFYLPEIHSSSVPKPVPPEDIRLIDSVLHPSAAVRRRGRHAAKPRRVLSEEVNRTWAFREIPDSAYKAIIEPVGDLPVLRAGDRATITIRVTNCGTETWPFGDTLPAFRIAHRWFAADESFIEGARTVFTADVAPGDAIVQPMTLTAPTAPGDYSLHIDMVNEHVRWFECGPIIDISIQP